MNWYCKLLARRPFIIILVVFVFSSACIITSCITNSLPNFSDPSAVSGIPFVVMKVPYLRFYFRDSKHVVQKLVPRLQHGEIWWKKVQGQRVSWWLIPGTWYDLTLTTAFLSQHDERTAKEERTRWNWIRYTLTTTVRELREIFPPNGTTERISRFPTRKKSKRQKTLISSGVNWWSPAHQCNSLTMKMVSSAMHRVKNMRTL